MSSKLFQTHPDWENQKWVARFQDGLEIPMDITSKPNPAIWTEVKKPKRGVKDWIPYIVDRKIVRHFSESTKTFYDSENPEWSPNSSSLSVRDK